MGWMGIIQRRSFYSGGMAGILRNRWPECVGIPGRNRSESMAGMRRNGWPDSIGISGRNDPEYASSPFPGL